MSQSSSEGTGCLLLIVAVVALAVWPTSPPKTKAEAQAAAMSETGDPPTALDRVTSKVNPFRGDFDEDRARETAVELLSGEAYEDTVGSAACTDDCSGHEAGWSYAAEGNDCGGRESEPFNEGCDAWKSQVEERIEAARAAYDEGDPTFAGEG